MFSLPLAANKATANQMKGLEIKLNFDARPGGSAEMAQLEDEMAAELHKEASNRAKGKDSPEGSPEKEEKEAAAVAPPLSRRAQGDRCVFLSLLLHPAFHHKKLCDSALRQNRDIESAKMAQEQQI